MNSLPPQLYIQQLNAHLQWQTNKIRELEERIEQLHQKLEAIQAQPTIHVDKIEYKFDQLKIEQLDGTLHIGVTPEMGASIEDMAVGGKEMSYNPKTPEPAHIPDDTRELRLQLDHYLDTEGRALIVGEERQRRFVLGEGYIAAMVEDIRQQLDERIAWYWRKTEADAQQPKARSESVLAKVKTDIRAAIEQHLRDKAR